MKCGRVKCQPTCKKSLGVFDSLPKKNEKSIKPYGMEVCELRLRGGKDDRSPVSRLRPLRSRCTFFSRPGVNTPLEQITVWFNALEEEKSFPLSFQLCNAPALLLKCSFVESSYAREHKTRPVLWFVFLWKGNKFMAVYHLTKCRYCRWDSLEEDIFGSDKE